MPERTAARGRGIAIVGAAIVLVAAVLPWYTVGGGSGQLTAISYDAFKGSGVLAFFAALTMLAVATLPLAMSDRTVMIDRPVIYLLVLAIAVAGIVLWVPTLLGDTRGASPTAAPGFWIAIVGTVVMAAGVYDIARQSGRL